jgi:hypothetical protein
VSAGSSPAGRRGAAGLDDERGLVAAAAVRHGRQVRAVGLEQQPVGRHGAEQVRAVEVRNVTIPAKEMNQPAASAVIEQAGPAGEAVEHAAHAAASRIMAAVSSSAEREWTTTGRPVSAELRCQLEHARCTFAGRVVVVVIEAGFADGDDASSGQESRRRASRPLPQRGAAAWGCMPRWRRCADRVGQAEGGAASAASDAMVTSR